MSVHKIAGVAKLLTSCCVAWGPHYSPSDGRLTVSLLVRIGHSTGACIAVKSIWSHGAVRMAVRLSVGADPLASACAAWRRRSPPAGVKVTWKRTGTLLSREEVGVAGGGAAAPGPPRPPLVAPAKKGSAARAPLLSIPISVKMPSRKESHACNE